MKPPRNADEALAAELGVSPQRAEQIRRRLPPTDGFADLDSRLRVEASLADLEAAQSIEDIDIADAALADDPLGELLSIVDDRAERTLRARLAAHASWAATDDPAARTRPAREAFDARFERQVDPEGVLPLQERKWRAEHARKAYFLRLALKSAQARRKKK